jgi:hypothetical protein
MDQGIVIEKINGRYYKPCPECGDLKSYLRLCYAKQSLKLNKCCKKCSNRKTDNCHRGWHRDIRISWFNKFKISAELRDIIFDISIDDIADLYIKQNKKCALTNWDIKFSDIGHPQKTDVSIDRIDSKNGYTLNNIQLIHKKVNMMKQIYTQEEFKEVCIAVCENIKKNN